MRRKKISKSRIELHMSRSKLYFSQDQEGVHPCQKVPRFAD